MKKFILLGLLIFLSANNIFAEDKREYVKLPAMMQEHMMENMRDHLKAINEILFHISNEEFDKAAQVAESRLGMSSLNSHKAHHMARFMPKGMAQIGTSMHKAASRFALKAEEEDLKETTKSLAQLTNACVACHANYKIK